MKKRKFAFAIDRHSVLQEGSELKVIVEPRAVPPHARLDGTLETLDSRPNLRPGMEPKTGAEELKKRFPMLQIRIYDAQTKTRDEVMLPQA